MRILVVSDSHGNRQRLWDTVASQSGLSGVIHLGDGLREAEDVAGDFPSIPFYTVQGNCDFPSVAYDAPTSRLEILGGVRVFCTHGHLYNVKYDLIRAVLAAEEVSAGVLLYGHTHIPFTDYREGLHIMNPGSLSRSYGLLDITPAGIHPHLVEVTG